MTSPSLASLDERLAYLERLIVDMRLSLGLPPNPRTPIPANDIPIESLGLSTRCRHALHRAGYHSVGAVEALDDETLLGLRDFGQHSFRELRQALALFRFSRSPENGQTGDLSVPSPVSDAQQQAQR